MEYRSLGTTGLEVSAIGMGCWAIGGDAWGPVDDADSVATIRRGLEMGVTLFDTADVYGRGRSEDVLREALGDSRDEVVLATKVGLWHSGADRPNAYTDPAMVVESCEASLSRLGTDRIDVYQCHLWWDENTEVFLEAFDRLKAQGKIRAYGVSTNEMDHLRNFDRQGTCDSLQVDYSILNREPEESVLSYCLDRSIGVIVKGPLKMGVLTGKFDGASTFPEGDVRRGWPDEPWFREALEQVEGLRPVERGKPMSQAALAFVLHHPAVTAAIPGAKHPEQIESNALSAERSLDESALLLIDEVAPPPERPA